MFWGGKSSRTTWASGCFPDPRRRRSLKTGKATGRKTRAVVKEQRQVVEPVHPTDAEMKRDERDVPPTEQDKAA
jgi:hypothetical protein